MNKKVFGLRPRYGLGLAVLAIAIVASLVAVIAFGSTQGPVNPTAAADDSSTGTVTWTNPADGETSNNVYSFAGLNNSTSHYLKLTGFGFSVPGGSTINGVTVAIERIKTGSSQDVRDASIKIVKASTPTGTDHADTGTTWPWAADGTATYGSATDLWGTTLTTTDVNAAGFGVAISAKNLTATGSFAKVDSVTITVTYTTGGGSPPTNTALPVVTGFARVSGIEHSTTGTWTGTAPITYAYHWQRCTPTCADISGATKPDYDVVSADQTHTLRVRVTASNSDGSTDAFSAQTGTVGAAATSWTAQTFTDTTFLNPAGAPYSAFVGAWQDPTTKDLWVSWSQASGTYSATTPQWVKDRGVVPTTGYDFWNLTQTTQFWKSTNHGSSWAVTQPANNTDDLVRTWNPSVNDCPNTGTPTGQNCKSSFGMSAFFPQADIQLANGDLLRRVNGEDIKYDQYDTSRDVTAYLQRMTPGAGGAWGAPQYVLDPTSCHCTVQISRIRRLRDGNLIALGQKWDNYNPKCPVVGGCTTSNVHWLLMVGDPTGTTWTSALTVTGTPTFLPNEWDAAELPNGDLLAEFRTACGCDRRQALLHKGTGDTWTMTISTDMKTPPFTHSGHPELIETSAGAVIRIATNDTSSQKGIWYLSNANAQANSTAWTKLQFPNGGSLSDCTGSGTNWNCSSRYYPRSFEDCNAGTCTIYVFGHVGADDPYTPDPGESITIMKFTLN